MAQHGTSWSAERSQERKTTDTIGMQISRKNPGDWPWIELYVISACTDTCTASEVCWRDVFVPQGHQ